MAYKLYYCIKVNKCEINIMGHFIKKNINKSSSKIRKINVDCSIVVGHKARVLTSADVEANRSRAYNYLSF